MLKRLYDIRTLQYGDIVRDRHTGATGKVIRLVNQVSKAALTAGAVYVTAEIFWFKTKELSTVSSDFIDKVEGSLKTFFQNLPESSKIAEQVLHNPEALFREAASKPTKTFQDYLEYRKNHKPKENVDVHTPEAVKINRVHSEIKTDPTSNLTQKVFNTKKSDPVRSSSEEEEIILKYVHSSVNSGNMYVEKDVKGGFKFLYKGSSIKVEGKPYTVEVNGKTLYRKTPEKTYTIEDLIKISNSDNGDKRVIREALDKLKLDPRTRTKLYKQIKSPIENPFYGDKGESSRVLDELKNRGLENVASFSDIQRYLHSNRVIDPKDFPNLLDKAKKWNEETIFSRNVVNTFIPSKKQRLPFNEIEGLSIPNFTNKQKIRDILEATRNLGIVGNKDLRDTARIIQQEIESTVGNNYRHLVWPNPPTPAIAKMGLAQLEHHAFVKEISREAPTPIDIPAWLSESWRNVNIRTRSLNRVISGIENTSPNLWMVGGGYNRLIENIESLNIPEASLYIDRLKRALSSPLDNLETSTNIYAHPRGDAIYKALSALKSVLTREQDKANKKKLHISKIFNILPEQDRPEDFNSQFTSNDMSEQGKSHFGPIDMDPSQTKEHLFRQREALKFGPWLSDEMKVRRAILELERDSEGYFSAKDLENIAKEIYGSKSDLYKVREILVSMSAGNLKPAAKNTRVLNRNTCTKFLRDITENRDRLTDFVVESNVPGFSISAKILPETISEQPGSLVIEHLTIDPIGYIEQPEGTQETISRIGDVFKEAGEPYIPEPITILKAPTHIKVGVVRKDINSVITQDLVYKVSREVQNKLGNLSPEQHALEDFHGDIGELISTSKILHQQSFRSEKDLISQLVEDIVPRYRSKVSIKSEEPRLTSLDSLDLDEVDNTISSIFGFSSPSRDIIGFRENLKSLDERLRVDLALINNKHLSTSDKQKLAIGINIGQADSIVSSSNIGDRSVIKGSIKEAAAKIKADKALTPKQREISLRKLTTQAEQLEDSIKEVIRMTSYSIPLQSQYLTDSSTQNFIEKSIHRIVAETIVEINSSNISNSRKGELVRAITSAVEKFTSRTNRVSINHNNIFGLYQAHQKSSPGTPFKFYHTGLNEEVEVVGTYRPSKDTIDNLYKIYDPIIKRRRTKKATHDFSTDVDIETNLHTTEIPDSLLIRDAKGRVYQTSGELRRVVPIENIHNQLKNLSLDRDLTEVKSFGAYKVSVNGETKPFYMTSGLNLEKQFEMYREVKSGNPFIFLDIETVSKFSSLLENDKDQDYSKVVQMFAGAYRVENGKAVPINNGVKLTYEGWARRKFGKNFNRLRSEKALGGLLKGAFTEESSIGKLSEGELNAARTFAKSLENYIKEMKKLHGNVPIVTWNEYVDLRKIAEYARQAGVSEDTVQYLLEQEEQNSINAMAVYQAFSGGQNLNQGAVARELGLLSDSSIQTHTAQEDVEMGANILAKMGDLPQISALTMEELKGKTFFLQGKYGKKELSRRFVRIDNVYKYEDEGKPVYKVKLVEITKITKNGKTQTLETTRFMDNMDTFKLHTFINSNLMFERDMSSGADVIARDLASHAYVRNIINPDRIERISPIDKLKYRFDIEELLTSGAHNLEDIVSQEIKYNLPDKIAGKIKRDPRMLHQLVEARSWYDNVFNKIHKPFFEALEKHGFSKEEQYVLTRERFKTIYHPSNNNAFGLKEEPFTGPLIESAVVPRVPGINNMRGIRLHSPEAYRSGLEEYILAVFNKTYQGSQEFQDIIEKALGGFDRGTVNKFLKEGLYTRRSEFDYLKNALTNYIVKNNIKIGSHISLENVPRLGINNILSKSFGMTSFSLDTPYDVIIKSIESARKSNSVPLVSTFINSSSTFGDVHGINYLASSYTEDQVKSANTADNIFLGGYLGDQNRHKLEGLIYMHASNDNHLGAKVFGLTESTEYYDQLRELLTPEQKRRSKIIMPSDIVHNPKGRRILEKLYFANAVQNSRSSSRAYLSNYQSEHIRKLLGYHTESQYREMLEKTKEGEWGSIEIDGKQVSLGDFPVRIYGNTKPLSEVVADENLVTKARNSNNAGIVHLGIERYLGGTVTSSPVPDSINILNEVGNAMANNSRLPISEFREPISTAMSGFGDFLKTNVIKDNLSEFLKTTAKYTPLVIAGIILAGSGKDKKSKKEALDSANQPPGHSSSYIPAQGISYDISDYQYYQLSASIKGRKSGILDKESLISSIQSTIDSHFSGDSKKSHKIYNTSRPVNRARAEGIISKLINA